MRNEPVIELENVSFGYNGYRVLEDVNLTIYKNDFICIVGPNAGGKTTLLKLILGLLKPSRGTVRVFGHPPVKTRSRMGYMPQHASLDLLFPVSVSSSYGKFSLSQANGKFGLTLIFLTLLERWENIETELFERSTILIHKK